MNTEFTSEENGLNDRATKHKNGLCDVIIPNVQDISCVWLNMLLSPNLRTKCVAKERPSPDKFRGIY